MAAAGATIRQVMVDGAVWREQSTDDGYGGQTIGWVDQGRTVPVQVVQPSAAERATALQEGVEVTHTAVMPVDVDIERGDRIVIGSNSWELLSDPLVATHAAVSRARAKQEPWDEPTT